MLLYRVRILLWTLCIWVWAAAPSVALGLTFTDDPLVPDTTTIKALRGSPAILTGRDNIGNAMIGAAPKMLLRAIRELEDFRKLLDATQTTTSTKRGRRTQK